MATKKRKRHSAFDDAHVLIPYARQSRARVGEQEDTSLSLDAQLEHIKSWGERMGYTVEAPIRDHDEDSETDQRAGLQALIANVRPGVTVAVELWDRMGRGHVQESIVAEIERRGGRALSVTQGSDRVSRGIYAVMGKEYLVQLSERLSSVAAQRVARGQHVGEIPYGFDKPGRLEYLDKHGQWKTRHTGSLIVDPVTAPVIARIFERWNAGDSLRQIAITLDRDDIPAPEGNGWIPQTVRWMLCNPVYAGAVRGRGVINWDGAHEAIITRDTWDAAQTRIARLVAIRTKDDPHWCEGLIVHSCGTRMLLNMVSRPGGGRYPSYRCGNANRVGSRACCHPRKHIGAPLLDRAMRACLIADLGQERDVSAAVAEASRRVGAPAAEAERERLTALRAVKESERDRARTSYLEGADQLAQWLETAACYNREIAGIDDDLRRLPHHPDVALYEEAAKRLTSFAQAIEFSSDDDMRAVVTELGVAILDERGVSLAYHSPYSDLVVEPVIIEPRQSIIVCSTV